MAFLHTARRFNSSNLRITPEGGIAVKMLAAGAIAKGEVVYVTTGASASKVIAKAVIDCDMPVGVAYEAIADTAWGWVVISGFVQVLPLSNATAAKGNVIYCSGTAGRVDQAASLPAVALHNREIGHFVENGSGNGALALAVVHFN